MSTQTDPRSLSVKPGEQQAQSSQLKEMARSSPRAGFLREGKFNIHAELPGLEPKDVKVEVENDALVIQGERRFEQEEKEGGVQRTERQYGLFYRSIPLPEGAKVDQAQAKFHNGVLEVTIPVPDQQSNRRTIPVEGESAVSSKLPQSQAA